MTRVPILLVALALAGCAGVKPDAAPGCHGARRPANPNGSVLAAPDAPATPPAAPPPAGGPCGGTRP